MEPIHIPLLLLALICCPARRNKEAPASKEVPSGATYISPLLPVGTEPWTVLHEGEYYYTQGTENKIIPRETNDIIDPGRATRKKVRIPKEMSNSYYLWGPEIHRIDGKWCIYFAADDSNTGSHHIYVIENVSANPLEGEFVIGGWTKTDKDDNWAIHANVFEHQGERYLIWCG